MTAAAKSLDSPNDIADTRRTLCVNGYWHIPVKDKGPRIKGWSRKRIKAEQVDGYLRHHADHQRTGILCGNDLVAIDIDAPTQVACDKLMARLMEIPSAAQAPRRTGKPPKCLFLFRATEPGDKSVTPAFTVDGQKHQVEILRAGQQFVAFGDHVETGKPYTWANGSPLDIRPEDLPVITNDEIVALLKDSEQILAELGERVKEERKPQSRRKDSGGKSFWQQVNTAALANVDKWVKALFSDAQYQTGTGAWRVSSEELGRKLEEDISIHPDGIQDFGREHGTSPIELVREYGNAPTAKAAAFWLCEQIGVEPADLGWEQRSSVAMTFGKPLVTPTAANDDFPDDDADVDYEVDVAGFTESLCYPPGAVGEFARFIVSCARFPSPHLALTASLAFTGGLIGRRYKGPTGVRSNIYAVGLAESGFGKDITIRATAALADSVDGGGKVSQSLFMDMPRSLPGLAGKLRKSPSSIAVIDEFGKFLALHAGRNVAPHREEIATAMMELTGAPLGFWGGQEKAAGNIPRIIQPCFSIHGISTPSTFWKALSSGNISEGLLGRLVLIDAGTTTPRKVRRPAGSIDDIPDHLAETVNALLGGGAGKLTGGPFYALNAEGDKKPWPIMTVEWSPGVDDLFEDFDDRIRARRNQIAPEYRPILNRVGENAARLALIVAVGCDPKAPIITREIQEWANAVAEHSFQTIVRGADANIADNDRSAEYLRVRRMIERTGQDGVPRGIIVKRLRGSLEGRRLDDIMSMLAQAGEIVFAKLEAKRGQAKYRYWSRENLPPGAEPVT
jgi:hypothetical protein